VKRLISKLSLLMAIAAAVAMTGQTSAYAVGAAGNVVFGSGTISPGLSTVPTPQTFTFTTSAPGNLPSISFGASSSGLAEVTVISCSFNGSSTLAGGETAAAGLGTGSGSCATATGIAGTSVSATCTLTYVRVGPVVIVALSCTATVNGVGGAGVSVGAFVFVPTSVNPTVSYLLAGISPLLLTS
jgi:hypothetical protein